MDECEFCDEIDEEILVEFRNVDRDGSILAHEQCGLDQGLELA